MENNNNINTTAPEPEEEGIDIMALVRSLWDGRKTIIICTAVFIVLGLVAALTMKRSYVVKTVMVPQMDAGGKSGLSSLASLAGFDMGSAATGGEISPLLYPQIVSSTPFRLQMMHTPLHYEKCDTLISMFDYKMSEYEKPSVVAVVLKYTIGLPGVIIKAIKGEEEQPEFPSGCDTCEGAHAVKPVVVSKDEQEMLEEMDKVISLAVDKKEGFVTLSVKGREPVQTAELALKAQKLLQDEVTRFKIEKSESDLEYIQARYYETKQESERYQSMLASVTDRTQNLATTSARVEKDRIQSKYNVANAVYLEMAKQLEQAKMQVKKDTPSFSVIQPVTLPTKSANSRAKTLIVWTFLGIVLGCGIVLVKYYWPVLMAKLKNPEEEETEK